LRYLGQAFGASAAEFMPECRGRHPHLRRFDEKGCTEQARAMLLGASNAWFPETQSALALPTGGGDKTAEVVNEHWPILSGVGSRLELDIYMKANPALRAALARLDLDRIWEVVEARKQPTTGGAAIDLLGPEWALLTNPAHAPQSNDFRLHDEGAPPSFETSLTRVVLVERLREVVALVGFTRVEGPDSGVTGDTEGRTTAPLNAKNVPTWVPASEVRGEGIFIQFDEGAISGWAKLCAETPRMRSLRAAHEAWRERRGITPADGEWPGARYVLVHSLAHMIINQVALECGYSAASIRERLYVRESEDPARAMAGVLLYTAAPDSEGTLGGMVRLGKSEAFRGILANALERVGLCSNDPFCAEHTASRTEDVLHNAACHACLFTPETSCERGNRYLDRAVLTMTMAGAALQPFFEPS